MIWASVAAFLQIIAITSHRWFTATSFGAELRMGLRDTQLCTLVGCRSTGDGSGHSTLMLLVFLLGWACAGLLVAAAVAHKRNDDDRLWRFAGIAATLQLALMIVVYIDPQDLNLDRGSAFLLCSTRWPITSTTRLMMKREPTRMRITK